MEQNNNELNASDVRELTLSQIVNSNFRAAAIFEKYNLDFCCGGNIPVDKACEKKGLDSSVVYNELRSLSEDHTPDNKFDEWNLDFLIDYIVNNHHAYILRMIPILSAHTQKIAAVHGKNHPGLQSVAEIFERVYKDLRQHMMKEEQILFPFIKQLVKSERNGKKTEAPYFGSVQNPIRMMEAEHQAAGDEMHEIRKITDNYRIPEDACNTYAVTLRELKEFEEDLHKHVYLENFILFPKSVKLESELV
ncbi:MAG TPA: iron-sulfur cluster repair di-iron protein [Ignavibacteriaceae bacterium]|nr:iron-sulfur cluster repair di-iron protein [Ignavibacteriaceae bacterium]